MVHTTEQKLKSQSLKDAGISLYLWENPDRQLAKDQILAQRPSYRRLGKWVMAQAQSRLSRPGDTLIQDYQFRNMSASLLEAFRDQTWQAVIVVQSSSAHWHQFLPPTPVRALMMHDVRALLFERKARTADGWGEAFKAWVESIRYQGYERRNIASYDLVIAVSPDDAKFIEEHYSPRRILTLPIPVDSAYFAADGTVQEHPRRIVFPGMMNYPPNADAACYFAEQVFPQIRREMPEAEFWIVGRDPTEKVQALRSIDGVHVTGFVPDIREYIAQAAVIAVPLRYGSGMRQKILEAWAMEKCVVSTSIGAEGLEFEVGNDLIVADGTQALTESCLRALDDPGLRDRVRSAGRHIIRQRHDPSLLGRRYFQTIKRIIDEKRVCDPPMDVYIDLRWMYPGRAGGIETLARSFLSELSLLDRHNHYLVDLPTEVFDDIHLAPDGHIRLRTPDDLVSKSRRFMNRTKRSVRRRLSMDVWLTPSVEMLRWAHDTQAEIALSIPGYLSQDVQLLSNVLVVPDIQHEYFPEFFSPEHLEERKRIYTASINKADRLCAISEFTRQTLIERLGVPPNKVITTYLAAQPRFAPGDPTPILDHYGLQSQDYIFFPGHTWPHKNHVVAIESLELLRGESSLDPLLVLTGSPRQAQAELLNAIRDLGLQDRVRFLGYCPEDHMPGLYQGAAALLFPSLFEGFGMPVLEAMSCGCPVVCSNTTSLPEVAGGAALLVDPTSKEDIATALSRALTDQELRKRMIADGLAQAAKFTWKRFTLQIVQALHQVRQSRTETDGQP